MQDKFLCLPNLTSSSLIEKMSEEYEVTEFDISKSNYYYRLRRIRKACLEHIPEDTYTPSLFEKNFILPKEREEGIAGNPLF